MYEAYRGKLAQRFEKSFAWGPLLFENCLYLSSWIIAGLLLWPLGGIWAALAFWGYLLTLQVILKKHVCSGCYYYGKRCHLGWGLLSARMCRPDSGHHKLGQSLALVCYIATPIVVLAAAIAGGVWRSGGLSHWILLGVYVALNIAAQPMRRRGCSLCAMRLVCPGSAYRKE